MLLSLIVNCILLFCLLVVALKYLRVRANKNLTPLPFNESSEINTEREKKEVKKGTIEDWRASHKETRRHFEKKRKKARRDKGTRRTTPNSDSKPPGKKRGKRTGAKGGAWHRPPEEHIDKVVHVHLEKCPECNAGKEYLKKAGGSWEHIISDFEIGKHNRQLVVTKYVIHRYRCKKCKTLVNMDFGILKNCHFGFGFIATVMQSRIESKHSYTKIIIELERWIPHFYALISKQTVVNWFKKYGEQLEKFFAGCTKKLEEMDYVHVDETGLPMNGKNWWLWVITTTIFALFIPHRSRGHDAIEEFFEKFEGVLISDFWGAYNHLTEEQQKCLAHLIRDIKKGIMESETSLKNITKRLEKDEAQKKEKREGKPETRGRGRPKKESTPLSKKKRRELEEKRAHDTRKMKHSYMLYDFFKRAWGDENEPLSYKARPEIRATEEEAIKQLRTLIGDIEAEDEVDPDIKRFIKRFRKHEAHLFTYLAHPGIPPDNNLAERDLRPFVIMRKTSHDFKNEAVMDSFTLYLSFQQTCKKNGVNFSDALMMVLSGEISPVLKALGMESAS